MLIVDGYNVLCAWRPHAKRQSIDDARDELTELLRDYAGYSDQAVTVVYDAWQSDRKTRTVETRGNFSVVFTQKGETADQYIERMTDSLSGEIDLDRVEVRVASSDGVEQTVILGRGATRLSARELLAELSHVRASGAAHIAQSTKSAKSAVMDHLPQDIRLKLERMRRT